MSQYQELSVADLKLTIELSSFVDKSETESGNKVNFLGQERPQVALEFGVAMQAPGYNIFVMGEPGSGRMTMVTRYLQEQARQQGTPSTYAYVDNFERRREPVVIRMLPGQGQQLYKSIAKLIDDLLATFPAAFESPSYQQQKSALEQHFNQRYIAALNLVEHKALKQDIALYRDNDNISFAPLENNKPLEEEQFNQLPQQQRDRYHQQVSELESYLAEVLLELPLWRRQWVEQQRDLEYQIIVQAIDPLFKSLNEAYENEDDVLSYLSSLKSDLLASILVLFPQESGMESQDNETKRQQLLQQYAPNIIVDYAQDHGSPVICEAHPIYHNLFGRIEYISDQGMLTTSYQRICPGSLHRANGGYLLLDAEKILTYPHVWDSLKRALQSGRIEIEAPQMENFNTITLKPEVIPLQVKVILVGTRDTYYLLQELDNEFNEMFRVLADFDNAIDLNAQNIRDYACLMRQHAADSSRQTLSDAAIGRLLEHSCRLAEHQRKFSAHIKDAMEIIAEADYFRSRNNAQEIDTGHIEQALQAREQRNSRMSQLILEEMLNDIILIDTQGPAIGKVNGLTVLEVGGTSFGTPTRITASVSPGSRGIVDIEREAELGQSIHSKGIMILTGYLGHYYAQQFPLAISASIAIEQSYGDIDGDSASLAELCSLISALTGIPIKQSFAVTGSINQYGEVQAVGGINEKIEGFFRLCQARGDDTQHAVIIPVANQCNLMLQQPVINAARLGKFSVYTVSTVNQALELLTGMPAGEMDANGNFPPDTINAQVVSRLKEIADLESEQIKPEAGESSD